MLFLLKWWRRVLHGSCESPVKIASSWFHEHVSRRVHTWAQSWPHVESVETFWSPEASGCEMESHGTARHSETRKSLNTSRFRSPFYASVSFNDKWHIWARGLECVSKGERANSETKDSERCKSLETKTLSECLGYEPLAMWRVITSLF